MKDMSRGFGLGLCLVWALQIAVGAQTQASPTDTFKWTITSPAAPNAMTQAECASQRYLFWGDANATKIRANIADSTAVGVPASGVVCSATSPYAVTATTTAGAVVGTAAGNHTVTITAERLLVGGTYAARVYGVPNCDFTFLDTRQSVPPTGFQIALASVLRLVGFVVPMNG